MDQLNNQRLESLNAMGGFGGQTLGSLGNLDSLGKLGGLLLQHPLSDCKARRVQRLAHAHF